MEFVISAHALKIQNSGLVPNAWRWQGGPSVSGLPVSGLQAVRLSKNACGSMGLYNSYHQSTFTKSGYRLNFSSADRIVAFFSIAVVINNLSKGSR